MNEQNHRTKVIVREGMVVDVELLEGGWTVGLVKRLCGLGSRAVVEELLHNFRLRYGQRGHCQG